MHMDLYKGLYTTPDAFLEDISFIENNAEIEGDPDSIVKAGQMTNHSKVMLDQTFDDAFRTDCARMAERAAEREKNRPTESKKGKEKEIARAAAAIEALDRTRHAPEGGVVGEGEGERSLKRVRIEGEEEDGEGEIDDGSPMKRPRGDEDVATGFEVLGPASTSNHFPSDAAFHHSIGVNGSSGSNGGPSSMSHLLDPSPPGTASGSNGPFSTTAASGVFSFAPGPTPILPHHAAYPSVPSAIPNPFPPSAFSSFAAPPLAPINSTSSNQTAYQSTSTFIGVEIPVRAAVPASDVLDSIMASITPTATPQAPILPAIDPVATFVVAGPSPPPVDPPTPEPLPDFVLSPHSLASLKTFLCEGTAPLNVDQLEQLRAACYDAIWRGRKEWDRDALVEELTVLSREFVEEVEECNAGEM